MKRVLIFSLAYLPRHVGGAEIAIKEITDRIPREDIEFHMITNRYDASLPRTEQVGRVLVHRIGIVRKNPTMADLRRFPLHLNKGLFQITAFIHAVRLHRRYHYDGIWAMMAHATGVPAALFSMMFPKVPFVLTLQEGDPPEVIERTMRIFWPFFTRAFTKATLVQSISSFLEAWSIRRGAQHTVVIPNGVDLARFGQYKGDEGRRALRAKYGVGEDEPLIITLSRLVRKNGIDTVIDALSALPVSTNFLIVGVGPEQAALRAQVSALNLTERVHFYGEASQEEIPELLAAADVFVRASRSEGQGIAFIEAMAAGIPTVGTDVGGIVDFLKEGETGFIAKPDAPKSIADAITRALAPSAKEVADRGAALARAQYDWELIAQTMREQCFSLY